MGQDTSIEWTDATWNPVRGCSRVSPGCENCYAESVAARFSGPGLAYEGLARMGKNGPRWTGKVVVVPEHLEDPLRWTRPRRVFVNSMSDLFHEGLSNEKIAAIFGIMGAAPQHTFQVLTKRAERMRDWFRWVSTFKREGDPISPMWVCIHHAQLLSEHAALRRIDDLGMSTWPRPNIWMGASVEDQEAADKRIPALLEMPAAVRFVSVEPLLGPVRFPDGVLGCPGSLAETFGNQLIHWIIAGAESGRGARPMQEAWVQSLRDQCIAQGASFFYKQRLDERGRKVSLPVLDGETWAEFPEART